MTGLSGWLLQSLRGSADRRTLTLSAAPATVFGMGELLFYRLLHHPLPDRFPAAASPVRRLPPARSWSWSWLTPAAWSPQERVNGRVRRGAAQALVREAYQTVLAEQDAHRRRPQEFTRAWKQHLTRLLDRPGLEVPGWGELGEVDAGLVWSLYEAAVHARKEAIERAAITDSRPVPVAARQTSTWKLQIVSGDTELGAVTYGTCDSCAAGLLYKIGFPADWQFCGFGRQALGHLETRHPGLAWYTSGQLEPGFFQHYRHNSTSPWTAEHHPCPHF